MTPLVSILIPAYNAEALIGETIESALGQTWPNKEIIVVDDGSTDGTLAVARRFASQGVHVVSQSNQGAAAARNHAYALSKGEYIQWLDADDLLAADKISQQMNLAIEIQNRRTLLSACWGHFYFRKERARFRQNALWCDLSPKDWLCRKMGDGYFMQTATWLVSRELAQAAGPWDTTLLGDDDGEYFCRVLLASDGVRFVSASRVYYRETDSSRLSYVGRSVRKLEAHFRSMQLHIGYLRSLTDDEWTRKACLRYLQRYLFYFYGELPSIVRQMESLAVEMGGTLSPPHARWKYRWIQKLFGWNAAKRAQFFLPKVRATLARKWDKALYRRKPRGASPVPARSP